MTRRLLTKHPVLEQTTPMQARFWPPRVVWSRETGWVNVRDPWGEWHSIPAKEAPSGYPRIASEMKRQGW